MDNLSELNQDFRKPDYLILASLIDIAFGAIGFIIGLLLIPSLPSILDGTYILGHMGVNDDFMSFLMSVMVISFVLISIPLVISGLALYQGYKWSKLLHTLSWIPSLLMFPIGTFLGIFAIWLVQTREVDEFLKNLAK